MAKFFYKISWRWGYSWMKLYRVLPFGKLGWTWWMWGALVPETTPWCHLTLLFVAFCRVWLVFRILIWGGVLLIPRSADEWKEGQTHMHVRLASIHSLASSGGVNTKPTRGRTDSLPDSDMHCLPVNPTTKRYFGSLEGLMLVTTNFP